MSPCVSLNSVDRDNHADPAKGRDAQYDWQGSEDEEGGAGSASGPRLGCPQHVPSWHDLHWNVSSCHVLQHGCIFVSSYLNLSLMWVFGFELNCQVWETAEPILQHHLLAYLVHWWGATHSYVECSSHIELFRCFSLPSLHSAHLIMRLSFKCYLFLYRAGASVSL